MYSIRIFPILQPHSVYLFLSQLYFSSIKIAYTFTFLTQFNKQSIFQFEYLPPCEKETLEKGV